MPLAPIKTKIGSTNIYSILYDPSTRLAQVNFANGSYQYPEVLRSAIEAIEAETRSLTAAVRQHIINTTPKDRVKKL